MKKSGLYNELKGYHFEWKHLLVLFIILIFFQIIISFVHKISLDELQTETQDWYKRDSAEKLAGLTATSLELLLETSKKSTLKRSSSKKEMIQAFNIIFSQQLLQENIEEIFILVSHNEKIYVMSEGKELYDYFFNEQIDSLHHSDLEQQAIDIYIPLQERIKKTEQIFTVEESDNKFHVFVPLVPSGEYAGAVYLKIAPDFSFINRQVGSNYDQTALIFSALILFGLLAMFYISSYTVKERDETQNMLFIERESHLRDQIEYQKESIFTKRIYHTHHKAEKIMGFIKEDIRLANKDNFDQMHKRMNKYANFVSRAIYDMKWYNPPVQTIRGTMFRTDVNALIKFLVENLFERVSENSERIKFTLNLDNSMPVLQVNEYVIWEILEPLMQNCIDHSTKQNLEIKIITKFIRNDKKAYIYVIDDGPGIPDEFMGTNSGGIKKLFLENISTKKDTQNSGYGCYLAYEISKKCGWSLDAKNIGSGGCQMQIEINNLQG